MMCDTTFLWVHNFEISTSRVADLPIPLSLSFALSAGVRSSRLVTRSRENLRDVGVSPSGSE